MRKEMLMGITRLMATSLHQELAKRGTLNGRNGRQVACVLRRGGCRGSASRLRLTPVASCVRSSLPC